ncbi:hypothetical protein RvY_13599-1 [Ramazzottius varieornatus]|uniref:N-acetyltransferase domain-containing protein n=1 Tax=Ramazzottius varieornatus TaxID=947166 RepID=A0A1D1VSG2_RAMVA|nr:hypothetical protein RvY_13599-1 [Ramazzottius varieornatus]
MEARLHSLRKCSDRFPLSLVMVSTSERSHKVLGHSRLASIPGRSDDCYVESVIVDRSTRRKGLGRLLMHHTENYAKKLGFSRLVLSTYNAQAFYTKLGYEECPPVTTMSTFADSSLLSKTKNLMSKMASSNTNSSSNSRQFHKEGDPSTEISTGTTTEKLNRENSQREILQSVPSAPPPPPLPMSSSLSSQTSVIERCSTKVYWMEKSL